MNNKYSNYINSFPDEHVALYEEHTVLSRFGLLKF